MLYRAKDHFYVYLSGKYYPVTFASNGDMKVSEKPVKVQAEDITGTVSIDVAKAMHTVTVDAK